MTELQFIALASFIATLIVGVITLLAVMNEVNSNKYERIQINSTPTPIEEVVRFR